MCFTLLVCTVFCMRKTQAQWLFTIMVVDVITVHLAYPAFEAQHITALFWVVVDVILDDLSGCSSSSWVKVVVVVV